MYATHPHIAQQIAREYTRDRIQQAETYRAERHARARTDEHRAGRPRAVPRKVQRPWAWLLTLRTPVL